MLPLHKHTVLYLLANPVPSITQAYQCYQEVKYISAMTDEFGVDDELRSNEELYSGTFERLMGIGCSVSAEEEQTESAALFEAACAEKIQQFDDSESDEEVCVCVVGSGPCTLYFHDGFHALIII